MNTLRKFGIILWGLTMILWVIAMTALAYDWPWEPVISKVFIGTSFAALVAAIGNVFVLIF